MMRTLLVSLLAALAIPAPASAAVAPGRIAISLATTVPASHVDAHGGGPAVALPDGGAIVVSSDRTSRGVTAVRLRADGSLEPSFGTAGIARIAVPAGMFLPSQLLRQPDGRLLVVGSAPASRFALQRYVVLRLTANGALDASFGAGGFAATTLQSRGGGGALAPDGSIVLSGTIGQISPEIATNPSATASFEWAVQRLTSAGAPDQSFGTVKVPGPAGLDVGGLGAVVRPSGQIVVLGSHGSNLARLAGLTATGAPDRSFNGGEPVTVPADSASPGGMLLHAGGAIDVVGRDRLTRLTPAGVPDASFGNGGSVPVTGYEPHLGPPSMLATADGGTLLQRVATFEPTLPGRPRIHVRRIAARGELGSTADLSPAFGGGIAQSRLGVRQNSFRGTLIARPNGSYLLVGGVSVVRYTGEGEGFSAGFLAVAALDPLLAPDASFGGPQRPARARMRLARQRVSSALQLRRVLARVTASAPGLVQLRVRDGRGRVLAQTVAPMFRAGTTTVRIALTATGRRILRDRRANVRVRAGYDFRDILAARDHGAVSARLR